MNREHQADVTLAKKLYEQTGTLGAEDILMLFEVIDHLEKKLDQTEKGNQ